MKKIERILAIITLLLDKDILTTTELAEQFQVTTRTIFRDIETIERAGFPIISYTGRNGGISLMNSFKLKSLTFTEDEKTLILDALTIKENLIGKSVEPSFIKEKIQILLNSSFSIKNDISVSSATIHPPAIEQLVSSRNKIIERAISKKMKLVIHYIDGKGEDTTRIVWPHELGLFNGSWFMKAFCEMKQAFRVFKVSRIREIQVLEEFFIPRSIDLGGWATMRGKIVKLEFNKIALGKLYDFYVEEEIQVLEEKVLVTFKSYNLSNTAVYLLGYGKNVTILEPEELIVEYQEFIKNLTKIKK